MGFFGISINENVADLKKQIATLSELIKNKQSQRLMKKWKQSR